MSLCADLSRASQKRGYNFVCLCFEVVVGKNRGQCVCRQGLLQFHPRLASAVTRQQQQSPWFGQAIDTSDDEMDAVLLAVAESILDHRILPDVLAAHGKYLG